MGSGNQWPFGIFFVAGLFGVVWDCGVSGLVTSVCSMCVVLPSLANTALSHDVQGKHMGLNFRCVGDGTQKRIMACLGFISVGKQVLADFR